MYTTKNANKNLKAENINYSSNSGLAGGIVGLTLGDINNCYTKDSKFSVF